MTEQPPAVPSDDSGRGGSSAPDHPKGAGGSRAALVALALACLAVPLGVLAWSVLDDDGGDPAADDDLDRVTLRGPAPPFDLETLDGGTLSSADYEGRPLVLAFMASWCAPCEEEIPVLRDALASRPGEFEVVSIMYRDLPADSRAFLAEHGADWPAARDDGDVAARYGVQGLPVTFFVDADGMVVAQAFGITDAAALAGPLDRLLARA